MKIFEITHKISKHTFRHCRHFRPAVGNIGVISVRYQLHLCCMLSFGWIPGVWILYIDVSERSVCSIFTGGVSRTNNRDEAARVFKQVVPLFFLFTPPMKMVQDVPKRLHIKFSRRGIAQKKKIRHLEHGESLKSRNLPLSFRCHTQGFFEMSRTVFWGEGGGSSMEEILGGGGGLGALKFSSLLSSEKCGHAVRYVIENKSEQTFTVRRCKQ